MDTTPFRPNDGATVNIDVSSSSQKVDLANGNGAFPVRVMNDGTATAWIKFGITTSLTATTSADIPIPAGAIEVLTVPPLGGAAFVAAIAAGSTGTIYFTPGQGI